MDHDRRCPQCDEVLVPSNRFCPGCGSAVQPPSPSDRAGRVPSQWEPLPPSASPTPPTATDTAPSGRTGFSWTSLVPLLVVVLIGAGIGGYKYAHRDPTDVTEQTQSVGDQFMAAYISEDAAAVRALSCASPADDFSRAVPANVVVQSAKFSGDRNLTWGRTLIYLLNTITRGAGLQQVGYVWTEMSFTEEAGAWKVCSYKHQ